MHISLHILLITALLLVMRGSLCAQEFAYRNLRCLDIVDTSKHDANLIALKEQNKDALLFCHQWKETEKISLIVDYRNRDTTYTYDFDPFGVISRMRCNAEAHKETFIFEFNSKGELDRVYISKQSGMWKDVYIKHNRVVKVRDHLAREGTREYKSFSRIPKDVKRMYKACLEHYEKNMGKKLECSFR